jgi:dTMP kinase
MGRSRRRQPRNRGVFITFEGIEGSGKSVQCSRLAKFLRSEGYRVIETREPGGTPFAEHIRELLLQSSGEHVTPECEVSLILAARSQHLAHVIRPALRDGAVVLCDRFFDSTLAYQGYGRGLDLRKLQRMNRLITGDLVPNLTFLFDLPVEEGLARRREHGQEQNRLDRETFRFHERVRKGFLRLAAGDPRIRRIDARADADTIAKEVASIGSRVLKRHHQIAKG